MGIGMRKNRKYSELSEIEKQVADACMKAELRGLDFKHPIRLLHLLAWKDYQADLFSYDGPTFSRAWNTATPFEIAALIHDWRNSNGYVSKEIDQEMFDIMITLNYKLKFILQRWLLCRFTSLNIVRHLFKGNLHLSNPINIYKL